MRINLTKKEIINSLYMQLGFSKNICEHLLEDFFSIILNELIINNKVKIPKFGTFTIKRKNKRIGRNPKILEKKLFPREMLLYLKLQMSLKNI